jgi:hypothetical protein
VPRAPTTRLAAEGVGRRELEARTYEKLSVWHRQIVGSFRLAAIYWIIRRIDCKLKDSRAFSLF